MQPRSLITMFEWLPSGVDLQRDVAPAGWILEGLRPWDRDGVKLESFIPGGYDAYARVFHPGRLHGSVDPSSGVRWADLGATRGVKLSSDVAFCEVSGLGPAVDSGHEDLAPLSGQLPPATCEALAAILRPQTRTPGTCWFCFWEGNGAFWSSAHGPLHEPGTSNAEADRYLAEARAQDEILAATPRVEAEARSYLGEAGSRSTTSAPQVRLKRSRYRSASIWIPGRIALAGASELELAGRVWIAYTA